MIEACVALLTLTVLILSFFYYIRRGRVCPKCGRYRALRQTGELKHEEGPRFLGLRTERLYLQVRCRYCGHEEWVEYYSPTSPGPPP